VAHVLVSIAAGGGKAAAAADAPVAARASVHVLASNDKCAVAQAMRIPRAPRRPLTTAAELADWDGGGSGPALIADPVTGAVAEFWGSGMQFQETVRDAAAKSGRTPEQVFEEVAARLRADYEARAKAYDERMRAWLARVEPLLRAELAGQVVTESNKYFRIRVPVASDVGPLEAVLRCEVGPPFDALRRAPAGAPPPLVRFRVGEATALDFSGY
jgi:hypothetical protein